MRALVSVPQAAEFLLPGGIPTIEPNRAAIGVEIERVHRDPYRGEVFFLELAG